MTDADVDGFSVFYSVCYVQSQFNQFASEIEMFTRTR